MGGNCPGGYCHRPRNDYAKYDSTYKWLCQTVFNKKMIMQKMDKLRNDYKWFGST
jgi:hypothetical protein